MRGRLSDKRYEHTLNVKKMAVKLAKIYGEDEARPRWQPLLHDSAKEISKDEMREILRAYPQYAEGGEERPARCGTALCAAILARTQWGVTDEAVLSAIACHTAGKPGMTRRQNFVSGRYDQRGQDWPGWKSCASWKKKESGCRHAGRAEADQRFRALAGKPLDPMSKGGL